MSLPIDRTAKTALDGNLVNGNTSDAPVVKSSNDVVYNTIDELYNYTSGLVAGGVLQPYPHSLYRQALINGNFDIWQRGTSFTNPVSGSYGADRWISGYDGTGMVHSVTRQPFAAGQTDVPNNPIYFYRRQVTTVATGQTYNQLIQKIENVNIFSGQKVSVSFWAKADAARSIICYLEQSFGGGGSAAVGIAVQTANLSTSWQKFSFVFTLPSISGKTIGTNHSLNLIFNLPLNTLMIIDITQVQINAGDQVLPFQPRSFADELLLCKRYCHVITDAINSTFIIGFGTAGTTTVALIGVYFPVQMRVVPTLVATATDWRLFDGANAGIALTAIALQGAQNSNMSVVISATVAAGLTQFRPYSLNAAAINKLMILDSEL